VFDPSIPFIGSPNFSSRRGEDPEATVIHYTAGGSASSSIRWLVNPVAKASSHFVISRSGRVTQLVDLGMKAWHVGISEMLIDGEMRSDANRFTIGIELANCGLLQKIEDHYFYEIGRTLKRYRGPEPVEATLVYDNDTTVHGFWEPFPDKQINALQVLLRLMQSRGYKKAAENIVGHEEIAMPFGTRKRDPGPTFPWERFRRKDGSRRTAQA